MPALISTLITDAKPLGPQCQQALPQLVLPHLSALLRVLTPGERHVGEEDTLSALHELLQAKAMGLPTTDGLLPWAALRARELGLDQAEPNAAWAWLTPCHWQVNSDHVRMANPADCQISADESQQVMHSMAEFFAQDGVRLHSQQQGNWLASAEVFKGLPTASLARASGGAVDHWLPRQAQAQVLRRLQNEMQMMLYTHPINDARAARGLLPINSFWISGTGTLPQGFQGHASAPLDNLRSANLNDDPVAWTQAWQTLDNSAMRPLLEQARSGQPVELILCAETTAQSFTLQAQSRWARLQRLLPGRTGTDISALLQSL